jgi:hypothetical protein
MPTPYVNLLTGQQSAPISTVPPNNTFNFQCIPAPTNQIKITGIDAGGNQTNWFSPNPAYLDAGSTDVLVTAQAGSPIDGWWSYGLEGMVQGAAPHIVVGSSVPGRERHERKAS